MGRGNDNYHGLSCYVPDLGCAVVTDRARRTVGIINGESCPRAGAVTSSVEPDSSVTLKFVELIIIDSTEPPEPDTFNVIPFTLMTASVVGDIGRRSKREDRSKEATPLEFLHGRAFVA